MQGWKEDRQMAPAVNNSTGFWTGIYLGNTGQFCAGKRGEAFVSEEDRNILRPLARKLKALTFRKEEKEKEELWYRHNSLEEDYPLILADPENGWNEIIFERDLECSGDLARRWEWILRRDIFWGEYLRDDRPVSDIFEIGYTFSDSEWGVSAEYRGGQGGSSYTWDTVIKHSEDIGKIRMPVVEVDRETSEETLALAQEVLGGELRILRKGINVRTHISRDLVLLLGMEQTMLMMYDEPDFIHRMMDTMLRGYLDRIDFYERSGLLTLNNNHSYVGSGGLGYTRELPAGISSDSGDVKTEDLWLHTESQETVGISPEMFAEFIYPYQKPFHERFGLNCYGCCEPLENRWVTIRHIPNLRRVSVSAWADEEAMAENLGKSCIYSRKPNPSDLASSRIDEESAAESIRKTLAVTGRDCVLEFVMKDNHTLGKNPRNIIRWVEITREEIAKTWRKP
jgi:hypothetical protein